MDFPLHYVINVPLYYQMNPLRYYRAVFVEWNVMEDAFQYLTHLFCLNGRFFLKF